MAEPTAPERETVTAASPLRIGLAVFVALAAAAALFVAGMLVGHDCDRDHGSSGSKRMMGGQGGMMGSGGMMQGREMMGGMGGMMVSSEREFLTEMIPHHEEAIESAKLLKAGTDRAALREFADDIIKTQQAEVDDMRDWLDTWYDGAAPAAGYRPMMRADLGELSGDELDRAFLEDTTMHHMMAVHMARSLISGDLAEHEQVADLARSIEETQREEIGLMHGWLGTWFDGVAGTGGGMPMMERGGR